jgi:hypothetical protein
MFSLLSRRVSIPIHLRAQPFSTTPFRSSDVSKLILVGRLGKDPELRITKSDKEYVSYVAFPTVTTFSPISCSYTVATTNYPPPPPGPDGSMHPPGASQV